MQIYIQNSSSTPIFQQIKDQMIEQILTGKLLEGEALPSIRGLAKDIGISIMTIKKAYDELELEGYIITKQGKGSYISKKGIELAKEAKQKELEQYIFKVVELSKKYRMNKSEVLEIFELAYEEVTE